MSIERDVLKTAAVLLAMVTLFVLIVWLPSRLQAEHLVTRIADAEAELHAGDAARKKRPALESRVAELRQQVNATAKFVPADADLAELMRDLYSTLQQHAARDINTQHGDEVRGARYYTVPITIRFRATFVDTFLIIERIESMHRLIRIDKLDVLGNRDNPQELLDVTVRISAFYAPSEGGS